MTRLLSTFRLIKRLPRAPHLVVLILIAGFAEGIGLSALVPVVSTLTGEASTSGPYKFITELFALVDVEPTFVAMLVFTLTVMLVSFYALYFSSPLLYRSRRKCNSSCCYSVRHVFSLLTMRTPKLHQSAA